MLVDNSDISIDETVARMAERVREREVGVRMRSVAPRGPRSRAAPASPPWGAAASASAATRREADHRAALAGRLRHAARAARRRAPAARCAQDQVYGPLLRRALEVARDQSSIVAATRALDAMEDAEELVVGVRPDAGRPASGASSSSSSRGRAAPTSTPASSSTTTATPPGQPGPSAPVRELVRERDEHGHPVGASLFELPGRTWVIATGDAARRAREAFAHPFGRPPLDLDPTALAIVRIDGPSLVSHVRALQDLGGLGAVGGASRTVTFALPPGVERHREGDPRLRRRGRRRVRRGHLREVVGAMARSQRPGLPGWRRPRSTGPTSASSSRLPSRRSSSTGCSRQARSRWT